MLSLFLSHTLSHAPSPPSPPLFSSPPFHTQASAPCWLRRMRTAPATSPSCSLRPRCSPRASRSTRPESTHQRYAWPRSPLSFVRPSHPSTPLITPLLLIHIPYHSPHNTHSLTPPTGVHADEDCARLRSGRRGAQPRCPRSRCSRRRRRSRPRRVCLKPRRARGH
jgi:hypothetical protein